MIDQVLLLSKKDSSGNEAADPEIILDFTFVEFRYLLVLLKSSLVVFDCD